MSIKKILGGLKQLAKEWEIIIDRNILIIIPLSIILGFIIGFPL